MVFVARPRGAALLPVDPSDEDLARDWTLSAADIVEVKRCRGDDNRLRFAIQLCVLRNTGRFVSDFDTVSVPIANHLGCQLDLPPVLFVAAPVREATDLEHERRIREYLGFRPFDDESRLRLEQALELRAADGALPAELYTLAEGWLRAWQILLPAPSTLERLVGAVAVRMQQTVFQRITERLNPSLREAIDALLAVPDESRSMLFQLKAYPPEATPPAIVTYVERCRYLERLGLGTLALEDISPELVQHLAQLIRQYDVNDLKRFAPVKRYALIACFLIETQKTILDQVVEMHHQCLTGISRRARHAFERRHKVLRPRAKRGLDTVLGAMEILLDPERNRDTVRTELYLAINEVELRQALESCRTFQRLEERGYLDELRARHAYLKRYLPAFLTLPFQGEPGQERLLAAIDLARRLGAGEISRLPPSAPIYFVPGAWRRAALKEDGQIDKSLWEITLAFAVRDALRAGDLYLPESRHHVSFWNLVYDAAHWREARASAYVKLNLPHQAEPVLERLRTEFDQVAKGFLKSLPDNPFAQIQDGALKLKRRDALPMPARIKKLRRLINTRLPRVRIENLLLEVDSWCHFTQAFRPLEAHPPRAEPVYAALLAALTAHGTNLGIATMANSTEGISVDMLHHVSRWFLRQETLKAANRILVNYHHQLPLSHVWGEGLVSSSDGQRFGIEASSLLASFYPRYFGYYDRAIAVYTHMSDQHSVFGERAISCIPHEALYVLDGLLENDTILRPGEHTTDTHGATEQLFGLCFLLGFSFMPRLADLKDQQLYRLDRYTAYGALEPLFHGSVDINLFREQWDQLVRVAASLLHRTAPAHVVLDRLAGSSPSDRLAKALTALGEVVKTVYILRYLHDPVLQQRVQLQLNRGESRHKLASWLFFANQGVFRTGDYEEIMNKVSALSLLSNAVLVWNTVQFTRIIEQLRQAGETVDLSDLARISPLAHAHVIPSGTYHFSHEPLQTTKR